MASKQEVINAHRANPEMNSARLADLIGCSSAYVRATAKRSGLRLPTYGPRRPSGLGERLRPSTKTPYFSSVREEAKAATRAALVEAARRCWAKPGSYETQGIRDIAAKAGYSTGAVFANFDSKADLWREAMGYEPPVDSHAVREFLRAAATYGRRAA